MRDPGSWSHRALVGLTVLVGGGVLLELAFVLDRPGELAWYRVVSFLYTAAVVACAGLAARAIHQRNPAHRVGWLLVLFSVGPAMSVMANGYTIWELPGSLAVTWIHWVALAAMFASLAGAILLFPDGRLPSPRWRWLAVVSVATGVASVAVTAVAPWPFPPYPNDTYLEDNPLGLDALDWAYNASNAAQLLLIVGALVSVVARWRATTGIERDQIGPMVVAGALVAVALMSAVVGAVVDPDLESFDDRAADFVIGDGIFRLFVAAVAVAIAAGVVRHRLYGLDRLMSRTLTYTCLLVIVGAVLASTAAVGANVVAEAPLPMLGAYILVAVLVLQPVRRSLESRFERRVFGSRPEFRLELERLTDQFMADLEPHEVPQAAADVARKVTGARAVHVVVVSDLGGRSDAFSGDASIDHWEPPLEVTDDDVMCSLAVSAGDVRAADLTRLRLIATTTAAAMSIAQMETELDAVHARLQQTNRAIAASHRRLIDASARERTRFRREVTERLVPIVGVLRTRLEAATAADAEVVARALRPFAVDLVTETRHIVQGVLPPSLLDLGLSSAIRSLARNHVGEIDVTIVDATAGRRFDHDLEVIAYLFCRALVHDAMTTGAGNVDLRLEPEESNLSITGSFLNSGASEQRELESAGDRIRAFGGSCVIEEGQITHLEARIPTTSTALAPAL